MNRKLFFYEITMLMRAPAFRFSLVLMAGLFIFAAWHQRQGLDLQEQKINEVLTDYQQNREKAMERLLEVERGEKSYGSMWDDPRGYYTWHNNIIRYPRDPFNFLAVGRSDLYEPLVNVGIFKKAAPSGRDLANPVSGMLGTFDPAFVLVFLMPLFIIGFTRGMISQEREAGVLPMLLMQPRGLWGLIMLKTLPRFTALAGAVILFLAAALLIAGVNPLQHPTRLLLLCAMTLAYLLFWFLAALALDLFLRSSAAHAVSLVCLWGLVCILLPAGISSLSKRLYPIPAQIEIINAMRKEGSDMERQAQKIMAQYYHDHPELTVNEEEDTNKRFFDFYRKTLSVGIGVEDALQPTMDHYNGQRNKQQALEQNLTLLSPAATLAGSLEQLAGTSGSQYKSFEEAVSRFGRQWRETFQTMAFSGTLISSQDPAGFPKFEIRIDRLETSWLIRLSGMLIINILLVAFIFMRLRGRNAYKLL